MVMAGLVGAKPTGQDINGSFSTSTDPPSLSSGAEYCWKKVPLDLIYGVILQPPSCPTRRKCTLGLYHGTTPKEKYDN